MLYANGQVPLSVVSVVLASGYDSKGRLWEHRLTPAMAQRWQYAVNYTRNKWGRAIRIRAGANAYRDLSWQKIARADACLSGNCNGASVPGYSSHGGNWRTRDCLAIDVDPNGLTWAQVWEACRAAGFECGLITEAISGIKGGEPWHIIDFSAFVALAAGDGSTPFPNTVPTPEPKWRPAMAGVILRRSGIPERLTYHVDTKYIKHLNGQSEIDKLAYALNDAPVRDIAEADFLKTLWGFGLDKHPSGRSLTLEDVTWLATAPAGKEIDLRAPSIAAGVDYAQIAKTVNDDAAERLKG